MDTMNLNFRFKSRLRNCVQDQSKVLSWTEPAIIQIIWSRGLFSYKLFFLDPILPTSSQLVTLFKTAIISIKHMTRSQLKSTILSGDFHKNVDKI